MNLPAPQKGLNYIVLKEMWTGQVNVGFPWLLTSTVTRHQPSRKQQSVLLLLLQLQTFLNSAFAQRAEKCAGKWKTRPVTHQCSWNSRTKFSSTFSFCRFSPRAGRLASGRTFFFFRPSFAADWLWFEAGKEDRCSVSPAGLLQPSCRALANRKRSVNGSHFSHQLLRTNACLRFSQEYNYISKEAIKVRAEAEASKVESVRTALRLAALSFLWFRKTRPSSDFFLSSLSVPGSPCSTAIEMSFLGFSLWFRPPDPALDARIGRLQGSIAFLFVPETGRQSASTAL